MIFSNLSGTTSNAFKVSADGKGQIQCNNTYDLFWAGDNPKGGRNPNVTQLGFGTDLNNIRTPGQYFAEGMTNEYPNCPTSTGFIMTVEPTGGITYPNYVTQRLYDSSGNLYVRTSNGPSGWTNWGKMAYESSTPNLVIETGIITPNVVSGYTMRNVDVRYTAYKFGSKIIFDVYGDMFMQGNTPTDTFKITNLPFAFDSYQYVGICGLSFIDYMPGTETTEYVSPACFAINGAIVFYGYGYSTNGRTVGLYGLNTWLGGGNKLFNLHFRVRIGG